MVGTVAFVPSPSGILAVSTADFLPMKILRPAVGLQFLPSLLLLDTWAGQPSPTLVALEAGNGALQMVGYNVTSLRNITTVTLPVPSSVTAGFLTWSESQSMVVAAAGSLLFGVQGGAVAWQFDTGMILTEVTMSADGSLVVAAGGGGTCGDRNEHGVGGLDIRSLGSNRAGGRE